MLTEAVCGNGLALMDSRDDDAPPKDSEGQDDFPVVGSTSSFIDDKLRSFSQELALAQTASMSNKSGLTITNDKNPMVVSKLEGMKSRSHGGVERTRYERFMALVNSNSKEYGAQSTQVADLYVKMGTEYNKSSSDIKSKELALLLFEEAFSIYQAKSGDGHEQTVDCRIHLGKTYHSLRRYDDALDCFCMAVYMREALHGELHPSVSELWVLISSVHHAKSKLELALKASAKALTGYRNAHGDKHHTVIAVLKTIAQIHVEMGNTDKAVDIQKYVRLHSPKGDDTKAEC